MTIAEMHVWFRQYAQQMGMQNVRAILPEQIDVLINTSITDTVNQLIRENIALTNDRIITDNSKIGQINALRTLYKVKEVDCISANKDGYFYNISGSRFRLDMNVTRINLWIGAENCQSRTKLGYYTILDSTTPEKVLESINDNNFTKETDIDVKIHTKSEVKESVEQGITIYSADIVFNLSKFVYATHDNRKYYNMNLYYEDGNPNPYSTITDAPTFNRVFDFNDESVFTGMIKGLDVLSDYMFLVDFSVNYTKCLDGYSYTEQTYTEKVTDETAFTTNYFPVRLIDDAYLADTLNDFVLKPRMRSPILVIYNGNTFDLYIQRFKKQVEFDSNNHDRYYLENNLLPYKFRCSYIAKPAIVKFAEDVNGINVDCDLPESMHVDILKHAVDLYRIAISGALQGAQQQQQTQQQENVRNNARDEGYQ